MFECVECPAMSKTRFSHKRILATFLPLSLLWTFVACVSLCERESSQTPSQPATTLLVEINTIKDMPDCDGCPLNSFPKAISPEQVKPVINLEAAPSSSPSAIPSVFYSSPDIRNESTHGPLCAASPPLDLLSTLRI